MLSLFRGAMPPDELDDNDWESLRVAVRVVYETEDLGASLGRKVHRDRDRGISAWSESMEAAITFMSWVRELTNIVTGARYSKSAAVTVGALWRRHRVLALRLLDAKFPPAKRISMLMELGGIEVSLWGQTWALEPMWLRRESAQWRPPTEGKARLRSSGKAARKREA